MQKDKRCKWLIIREIGEVTKIINQKVKYPYKQKF